MATLLRRRPWQEEAMAVLSAAAACHAAPLAVPLLDALGLVLTEDVRAPDSLPLPCHHRLSRPSLSGLCRSLPGFKAYVH
ncbi:molybdenum cofactor biosynthesis protein Cnx1 [Hordeum vulgare]|nr:molybdenum cofactor biosynthesis protein Cnx1 [Hordeum vulgare]KAE8792518.1 molybdenum cofactor biosynthesis protein Cnx1 [Hordeum vulgare]